MHSIYTLYIYAVMHKYCNMLVVFTQDISYNIIDIFFIITNNIRTHCGCFPCLFYWKFKCTIQVYIQTHKKI